MQTCEVLPVLKTKSHGCLSGLLLVDIRNSGTISENLNQTNFGIKAFGLVSLPGGQFGFDFFRIGSQARQRQTQCRVPQGVEVLAKLGIDGLRHRLLLL